MDPESDKTLLSEAVGLALKSKERAMLCMSAAWILTINHLEKPKRRNQAAIAIALAVARCVQHGQGGTNMIQFPDSPQITHSNLSALNEWVANTIQLNDRCCKECNGDNVPLQVTIKTLMTQLRGELVTFRLEYGNAREAGLHILSPGDLERQLAALGLPTE